MRIVSSLLTIVSLVILSCSPNIFGAGDRYREKGSYENALLEYKKSLKRNTDEARKARLELKIASTYYEMGKKTQALEILSGMSDIPQDTVCPYATLFFRTLNDMGRYDRDRRSIDLLEKFENSGCVGSPDIDNFYAGLRKIYYPLSSRTCDRFMIKGNLKRDTGDIFAAMNYYKQAVKCNPMEEDFLLSALDAFGKAANTMKADLSREQRSFFINDYPSFFALISELYSKNDNGDFFGRTSIRSAISELTGDFSSGRAALPISIYSSVYFQDQNTLIKTVNTNEKLKYKKVDEDWDIYIILSPEKSLFGISEKISADHFIPE